MPAGRAIRALQFPASPLPEVRSIYEAHRGGWACTPQTSLLRYFLRVSPDFGVKEVSTALALRKDTGCYRTELSDLREYVRMPQVEKVAIAALDDPEPAVARDAAQALQHYGTAAAESALWGRLEKFHRKWKDRPDELLHPRPNMIVYDSDSGLEEALVQGISLAQAWFADAATIRRLKDLSSPAMQRELDDTLQALGAGAFNLNLSSWPEDELSFTVGSYSGNGMGNFKEKLAQFPPGSHFRLITTQGRAGDPPGGIHRSGERGFGERTGH
jgi:hypothetical protein